MSGAFGPARAAEAYLCGPDRIVYVAVEDLEAKKRSDPCIAAYFGLKIEPAAKAVTGSATASPSKAPVRSPKAIIAELKPLAESDILEPGALRRDQPTALALRHRSRHRERITAMCAC